MSYIQAFKFELEDGEEPTEIFFDPQGDGKILDSNLDDEILNYVVRLIRAIDDLGEGEAILVRKVIF